MLTATAGAARLVDMTAVSIVAVFTLLIVPVTACPAVATVRNVTEGAPAGQRLMLFVMHSSSIELEATCVVTLFVLTSASVIVVVSPVPVLVNCKVLSVKVYVPGEPDCAALNTTFLNL